MCVCDCITTKLTRVARVAFLLVALEDQILSAAQQVVLVWLLSASIEVDRVARVTFLSASIVVDRVAFLLAALEDLAALAAGRLLSASIAVALVARRAASFAVDRAGDHAGDHAVDRAGDHAVDHAVVHAEADVLSLSDVGGHA